MQFLHHFILSNFQAQSDDSDSHDVELNSATEISTDSEFDHDPPPKLISDDKYVRKPHRFQVTMNKFFMFY